MGDYSHIDWLLLKPFRQSRTNPKTGRQWKQEELAHAINKKQSYISRLEKGHFYSPESTVVNGLAAAFGLPPHLFLKEIERREAGPLHAAAAGPAPAELRGRDPRVRLRRVPRRRPAPLRDEPGELPPGEGVVADRDGREGGRAHGGELHERAAEARRRAAAASREEGG